MSSDSDEEFYPIDYSASDMIYTDPRLVSGLLKAVLDEDICRIKCVLAQGRSVNVNDNNGNTALHLATIRNLPEIIDFLLSVDNINVNARNVWGQTPLYIAVRQTFSDIAAKLIQANANVNLPSWEDVTPLHLATANPQLALVLIKNGAHINAQDYSGETPLHEAVSRGHLETVCMLLYFNADANITCENNLNPFMRSLLNGHHGIQSVLIEYVSDFNTTAIDGWTTLDIAITHNTPYLEEIIRRGADINYKHPELNAFQMCCSLPNEKNFRLIWNKFEYQKLSDDTSYWGSIVNIDDMNMVHAYACIIIDTGNVKPFVEESKFLPELGFLYVLEPAQKQDWATTLPKFVYLLLSYGVIPNSTHMDTIFQNFPHCELFYTMLHMDVSITGTSMTFARLIYDCSLTVDKFIEKIQEQVAIKGVAFYEAELKQLAIHLRHPILHNLLGLTPQIPSLLELTRNKIREYFYSHGLKSSKEFYSVINWLPAPKICKEILSFKRPIYLETW
ncbi:nuclear factor NF-kappa-B p105 subunit-like [Cylas formicarius]|uniref:nuclear factor NF-kappa-B p105 subunit-like n=1 Tax=Cylas formicarius TaxID=197179 RepID=UPI00295877C9|nr:nuclear factor NF-kappa-B p105 subunit-like [Cylas formicarius]